MTTQMPACTKALMYNGCLTNFFKIESYAYLVVNQVIGQRPHRGQRPLHTRVQSQLRRFWRQLGGAWRQPGGALSQLGGAWSQLGVAGSQPGGPSEQTKTKK